MFIAELLGNGVTIALAFATSHPSSVDALMDEAQKRRLRMIAGKVLIRDILVPSSTHFDRNMRLDEAFTVCTAIYLIAFTAEALTTIGAT